MPKQQQKKPLQPYTAKRLITIFGGSGFIGRYSLRPLAKRGFMLRIVTRKPQKAGFVRIHGDVGHITPVYGNIHDPAHVDAHVKDAYAVINLVGILKEPLVFKGRTTFAAIHHHAAARIASSAQKHGVERLIHISALGIDQQTTARYARSKYLGEQAVMQAYPSATILRPGLVFGHEDQFFPTFARLALLSPILPVFVTHAIKALAQAGTCFHPVYVGDVGEAIARVLIAPQYRGKRLDVVGTRIIPFGGLMDALLRAVNRRRLLVPVPLVLARLMALVTNMIPPRLLTPDQVRLLAHDNISQSKTHLLTELGITPKDLEDVLPAMLARWRKG